MLFIIYLISGVFFLVAARNPVAYVSFLNFTMWANLFHGLLMAVQTATMMDHYWSKWFTDIPFVFDSRFRHLCLATQSKPRKQDRHAPVMRPEKEGVL